jgi:DNA-directed RNA polymerase subunit RPC12/RpoP
MSKHKYVCFECKQAIKRDFRKNDDVRCSSCGVECTYLGVKIPIPPKSKPKLWENLKVQLEAEKIQRSKIREKSAIARKHKIEKEIKKLENLTENSGRRSLIKRLKNQLAAYNA